MRGSNHICVARKGLHLGILPLLLLLVLVIEGCRRDLWVYGDQFHSVRLDVDWRQYSDSDPGGMTAWFFPRSYESTSVRYTTAQVRHLDFYLGEGSYAAVVCDYSPDEFSHQEFLGMDRYETAEVRLTPASYQPDSLAELYGPACFASKLSSVEPTGLYTVVNEPEEMALDTLTNMNILSGKYKEYVPYKERDTYQSTLTEQVFSASPKSLIWRIRIRVFIKGLNYLYNTQASLVGLANSHYLARHENGSEPCLLSVDNWKTEMTGDNEGYIATTVNTFGLPCDWNTRSDALPQSLRLNLRLLLRDRKTVLYYHFDVGQNIVCLDDQQVLRVDLTGENTDCPDLPHVDAFNGTGFDGVVTPWDDNEPPADIVM